MPAVVLAQVREHGGVGRKRGAVLELVARALGDDEVAGRGGQPAQGRAKARVAGQCGAPARCRQGRGDEPRAGWPLSATVPSPPSVAAMPSAARSAAAARVRGSAAASQPRTVPGPKARASARAAAVPATRRPATRYGPGGSPGRGSAAASAAASPRAPPALRSSSGRARAWSSGRARRPS